MRYNFKKLFTLLLFFTVLIISSGSQKIKKNKKYNVMVLLKEKKIDDLCFWKIFSGNGFLVSDPRDGSTVFHFPAKELHVKVKGKYIYLGEKKFLRSQVRILPKKGDIFFNGNHYQGSFNIVLNEKKIYLINCLELEDYVFSVLRSESWPGWPLEVNKVFSVAIRSYVISKIGEAKKLQLPYHVKNTNIHQTYNGYKFMVRNSTLLRKAVNQTKGIFLAYNNEPVVAMFDSCCGGVIPSLIEDGVDFVKAPYLARDYPCKYCRKCSLYKWKVEYTLSQLENILNNKCPHIKNIKSIWVSKKDKAGLVKEVSIRGRKKTWKISGDKLYSLLKDVKSFCFSIKKRGKKVFLNGKGFGHHVGICQWGVRQMVREFWDYKRILKFYYPGTSFVCLS